MCHFHETLSLFLCNLTHFMNTPPSVLLSFVSMIKKRHKKFNKTHFFPSPTTLSRSVCPQIPWNFLIATVDRNTYVDICGTSRHKTAKIISLLISFLKRFRTFLSVVYELQRNFQEYKNLPCDVLRSTSPEFSFSFSAAEEDLAQKSILKSLFLRHSAERNQVLLLLAKI